MVTSKMMCVIFLLSLGACAPPPAPPPEAPPLPDFRCVRADAANPVFYENSSAEWAWSPDGDSILFDRAVGEVSQLRLHHLASGRVECITSGEFHDSQPTWSPRGDRIAFVRRLGGVSQIHLMDLHDGAIQAITRSKRDSEYPCFSRDGRRLAYVRFVNGEPRRRLAVVRDMATGDERVVFDSPFGLNNLAWNADDTTVLLYSIDDDGWNDLYEAAADGSGVRRLTDNTVTDSYSPEISADGSRMLFGQGSEVSPFHRWFNYDLYEKNLETGTTRRMTWAFGADDRGKYSPDRRSIGFTSRRSGYAEIYLMDQDGGNLRAVTEQPDEELGRYVERHGLPAARKHLEGTRGRFPDARLIGEAAAFVMTRRLLARGEQEDAVVVARLGVDTHPDSWRTQTALGEALLAVGNDEGAVDALRRSVALFPNQYQIIYLLGFAGFSRLLDSIDGIWRENGVELFDLARSLQSRGEFLSSLRMLKRLDEAYPDDTDVLSALARTQMMLGDHSRAAELYRRVLQLDSVHRDARLQLRRIESMATVP